MARFSWGTWAAKDGHFPPLFFFLFSPPDAAPERMLVDRGTNHRLFFFMFFGFPVINQTTVLFKTYGEGMRAKKDLLLLPSFFWVFRRRGIKLQCS